MKPNLFVCAVAAVVCALILLNGCQEEAAAPPQQLNPSWFLQFEELAQPGGQTGDVAVQQKGALPKLSFAEVVHDFGLVSPETSSRYEFPFKNAGTGVLKIENIEPDCGCTVPTLDKTEYAPGEAGTLKVQYLSDAQFGPTTKQLKVRSNDPANPEVTLAINATIAAKIDYEPKILNLVLSQPNAGCPPIKLVSIDNQPFAITHVTSTSSFVSADFDPAAQATSFVIEPKVNMPILEATLNGVIEIGLSHPECKKVLLTVNTLPRFRISPRSIVVRGYDPNQPIVRTVRIQNNYNEPFEPASATSPTGAVKVTNQALVNGAYELQIEIKPPTSKARTFSETLTVRLKDGRTLEIPCNIFHSGGPSAASEPTEEKKDCKICGARIIDPSTGQVQILRNPTSDKGT